MQRSTKVSRWIGSMAIVALLAGATARAADPAMAGHATVTVKVVDADGKPAAGAKVSVMAAAKRSRRGADAPTSQPAARPPAMTATTDADGTAMVKDVPDGSYNVRVTAKGSRGRGKVTVADGKAEPVSVTLAAGPAK